jgi:hypothetical protein
MRARFAQSRVAAAWLAAAGLGSLGCTHAHDDFASDAGAIDDAPMDGGTGDAVAEASACRPGSIAGFAPKAAPGPLAQSNACNGFGGPTGFVSAYGEACLAADQGSRTYSTCAAFGVPDASGADACFHCLITPEDASTYRVVVLAPIGILDYAGCIQAVDPSDAGRSCAQAMNDAYTCAEYACKPNCPVTDDTSYVALTTCLDEASKGPCLSYTLLEVECLAAAEGDGGTRFDQVCFHGDSVLSKYLTMAQYFCGAN